MKTKTIFLLCLFLGFGLTQLTAQNGKNGTGALILYDTWKGYYINIPVICGGVTVDRLVGTGDEHIVVIFKNSVPQRQNVTLRGEVTNFRTNEIFKVKDFWTYTGGDTSAGHFNIIGDKGSHYIIHYIYYASTDTFTFEKAVCN